MKKTRGFLLTAGILLAITFTLSCSGDDGDKDEGGGSCSADFGEVKIGSQTWAAENSNCNVEGSKCYDDAPANCEEYGRLYTWSQAKSACPKGWHLPTKEELEVLGNDAKKLKATSFGGTDDYNFSAMPGGHYSSSDGNGSYGFYDGGYGGFWWSASEGVSSSGDAYGWVLEMYRNSNSTDWDKKLKQSRNGTGMSSVRCLKN